jgi:hypothetical protein
VGKLTAFWMVLCAPVWAQYFPPSGGGGAGSVTISGTTNQITATGTACTAGNTGTCVLSLPNPIVLNVTGNVSGSAGTVTSIASHASTDLSDTAGITRGASALTTPGAIPKVGAVAGTVGQSAISDNGVDTVTVTARKLNNIISDSATNSVSYAQRQTHISSAAVVAGFGLGKEVELETATDGVYKVAQTEQTTWLDPTAGSETAAWQRFLVIGGIATEVARQSNTEVFNGAHAGQFNTGAYPTMTGFAAGYANTGAYPTMTGVGAGQFNTGANPTITGVGAGQSNTGAYPTMTGFSAGQSNTGAYPTMTGVGAGQFNTGEYPTMTGAYAGYQNNWPNVTQIGARTSTTFAVDATTDKAFAYADVDGSAHTITYGAPHGFGTVGNKVNLLYTKTAGTTSPTGLVTGAVYQFSVTSATILTLAGITDAGSVDFQGKLTNSLDVTNSIAIGVDAAATKPNQAVLGPATITETLLRGNVGIGTTNPTSKLTVAGAISDGVTTATNSDNRGHLTLVAGTATYTFTQGPGVAGIWTTAPVCIIQDDTTLTNLATSTKTVTNTDLTITGAVGTTDTYSYICWPGN